jgi:alpha-glucosidase
LYEDAGDGFQYQKGEYRVWNFTAKQAGSVVKVAITANQGRLKPTKRKYKIIVVTDTKTIESDWIAKNRITIKMLGQH